MRKSCVAFALTAVILVVSTLACGLQAVISPAPTPTPTAILENWKHKGRLCCSWRPFVSCPTTRLGYERREK
jgi:hypothetical protein